MEIKDIRIFREFYKTNIIEVKDSNRNPHFAGDVRMTDEREFGFFHMFNGHGDIENKLTTILNIAGDSQAIYEFMQNAVDADSKTFFLAKYGTEDNPYLIVLNDGEYFNLQSIISILAIGASSKYRNPDNIGQFGVGFKLAHRLIGADNSLKELLEENKGPLLFSWANGELTQLADINELQTIDPGCKSFGNDAVSTSDAPWLFKIVATNFPCLINDPVLDAKGRAADSLFTEEDLVALKGAAKQCLEQCKESVNFQTGTLLVIPLHPAKVEHVIGQVPKGLEVAATIISRRAKKAHDLRTQIENTNLAPEQLNAEQWELREDETSGRLGNEQVKNVELMFLYGNPFESNSFKGKPQFYRYFPMSLEQHGFRFAIHSNALTLSSARTELQENDSNKFLLGKLVPLLEKRLKEYAVNNYDRFCELYASILLSNRGEGANEWIQGRQWLESILWQPLMQMLKNNVPFRQNEVFALADQPERVVIKNSRLPIENWYNKEHSGWFIWKEKEQSQVCFEANEKLGLKSINLLDVLADASSTNAINAWLSQSADHAAEFLKELNDTPFEDYDKTIILKNVNLLNLWWFGDAVYSIDKLAKDENLKYHLINFGPLKEIKDELKKVDILTSFHFLDDYPAIERPIRESVQRLLPYLFNYEELNKHLSIKFSVTAELNPENKRKIFGSIESAVRSGANTVARRIDTMKPLALFSNKRGEVKSLFQLSSVPDLPQMLQGWRINEGETVGLNLSEYLSNSKEAIYDHIIKPFWEDIAKQENQDPEQRVSLFRFVKVCYTLKPTMGALPTDVIFFTEAGIRTNQFYHPTLTDLDERDYKILSDLLPKIGCHLPQKTLLGFYNEAPFLLPASNTIMLEGLLEPLHPDIAKVLLSWLLKAFPELAKDYLYCNTEDGKVTLKKKLPGVNNYIAGQEEIRHYITNYFSAVLLPLPNTLRDLIGDNVLNGEKLLERLIIEAKSQKGNLLDLSSLILKYGNDTSKQKLLSDVPPIDITKTLEINSLDHSLLKLCFSISNGNALRESLGKLAYITKDNKKLSLNGLQNRGSDALIVDHPKKGKLSFSVNQLLGGEANEINQVLTSIADHWEKLGLGTLEKISIALGVNEHRNIKDVWEQMLQHLHDGKIENGEQLSFIWAVLKPKDYENLDLKVKTLAGWAPLKHPFYLQSLPFIPKEKVLDREYETITKILKLDNELLESSDWTLQTSPFLKVNQLVMPGIENIIEQDRPAFWKYLFKIWETAGCPNKIILPDSAQSWLDLLGLLPTQYILAENYSLPEEKIPTQLLISYGLAEDKIDRFMAALGAQEDNAAVVKTRKFFNKDGGNIETGMTPSQIVSTLKWLSVNRIEVQLEFIAPFYKNLSGKCVDLIYFPAYTNDSKGLKIISLSDEVYHIHKEDLLKLQKFDLKAQDIAGAANSAIIIIGTLQDWTLYLTDKTDALDIKWKETDWDMLQEEAIEWEFPFYLEWKSRYLHFQILSTKGGEIPRKILINGTSVKQFRNGKVVISQDTNIVFVNGMADTEDLLNEIDKVEAFNTNARNYLRQCFQAQTKQFEQFIELAKNDSGFAQLLKDRAETIKLQEERTARAEVVKNPINKYTLDWFLNLLELARVQEKSVNIPELTFSKCERLPASEKTYELSESNGRIPSNIETFDEIPAIITYLNLYNEPIIAKTKLIASEKHQKLWVMFPEVAIQPILEEPKKIVSIKLEFTRKVELIDELKHGFHRLDLQSETNLKATLSKNIDFIFGPPGTGKTTELARRIINKASEKTEGPVVILTPTNKAADVLTKKIIELNKGIAPLWLVRAGTCTDPFLLKENVVKQGDDLLVENNSYTVIITTIHRFPYFTVPINRQTAEKSRLCDCPWTEVIFDEASMIPAAYITYAIHVRQMAKPETHFLVAGDPLQIPPVFDLLSEDLEDIAESLQEENIYSMIGLKSFNTDMQQTIPTYGNRIHNLKVQHRSIPAIGEIFSKFQYESKIGHSRGTKDNNKPGVSRPLPQRIADLGFKPITIIRYPVKSGDSIFKPQKLDDSPIHLYTSLLVSECIKLFRSEVKGKNDKPWSIGVLAPYRSQADVMLKMIEAHPGKNPDVTITTDTVHGFQGDENNIVFAVFNPSGTGDNISYSRFLKKQFIINVAISRAEDYLIMFIPDENSKGISGLPLVNQLLKLANETEKDLLAVMHSSELEEKLKGEKNYFGLHSFSTAHQKVNVYGKPDLPYIIKINERSLDVHWDN